MTKRSDRLKRILGEVFAPVILEITDESASHAGHAAQKGIEGGETHYHVLMVAERLAGQSRVARARAVHTALDAEFKTGLHALSLTLRTPAETPGVVQ